MDDSAGLRATGFWTDSVRSLRHSDRFCEHQPRVSSKSVKTQEIDIKTLQRFCNHNVCQRYKDQLTRYVQNYKLRERIFKALFDFDGLGDSMDLQREGGNFHNSVKADFDKRYIGHQLESTHILRAGLERRYCNDLDYWEYSVPSP